MVPLLLSSLLLIAAPCVNTSVLEEGAPAPCSGLLWSVDRSKAAVRCARVTLPECESEVRLCQSKGALCRAQIDAILSKPPPPPSDPKSRKFTWALGAGAAGLVAGFLGVLLLGVGR